MKQRLLLISMAVATVFSLGLYISDQNNAEQLYSEINQLESQNASLKREIENLYATNAAMELKFTAYRTQEKLNDTIFPTLITLSNQFSEARINGDLEVLEALLSHDYWLEEKDGEILAHENGQDICEVLYSEPRSYDYKSRALNSFWYIEENDTYIITFSEYYKGNVLSGLYVVMEFKLDEDGWHIVSFGYDV